MRVVQIGLGGWGKNHTRILSQLGVLKAVCDMDEQRAKEFGARYDVNYYSSLEKLLEHETFDTAFVCTPTKTHFHIVQELLSKRKNVFVEKPLTTNSHDGYGLTKLAKENNVILTCGYIERFNPVVSFVKNCIESQRLGGLIRLEFQRENKIQHVKDVGIIHDTSVHDIDTAIWLFGEPPRFVFARAGRIKHEHEDFANMILGFKHNRMAVISSNWVTPIRERSFKAVFHNGVITGNFISQEIKIETDSCTEIPRNTFQEPLSLEINNFLEACRGKGTLLVQPEMAVLTTKIAEAAITSNIEQRIVNL